MADPKPYRFSNLRLISGRANCAYRGELIKLIPQIDLLPGVATKRTLLAHPPPQELVAKGEIHGHAGVGRLLLCIGPLWKGNEATFRGIIPIPYLLRRSRRSRVYGGFVFVLVLCVRWFRVISLVSHPVLGLLCGVFVFCVWLFVWHTATALLN